MAKKLTSGQITITDLNDGRVLSKYTNASQGYTQIYDTENKTYSVNYTTTPQVITASVYASGTNTNDQASTSACSGWKWYVNGTQVTSSTTNMTAAANKLTIKQNLTENVKTYVVRWECTFHDDITGTDVVITDSCTVSRVTSGTSAVFVDMLTPKGTIFDGGKTNLDKLQIVARLMRGAQIDTTNLTFKWSKLSIDDKGALTWTAITTGITTANGTSTLEVGRDDVDGSQTFKVEISDSALKDGTFQGFCTVLDKLDEYNVVLVAPQGTAIKNGQGSVTVTAQVYKNNEVMADTTGLTFTWYKYDKTGKQVNWSGTGTPATKTGNPITVTAADVNVTTTIMCEVDQG